MDHAEKKVFLGRQPILDRNRKIVGYELLFRSADTLHADIAGVSHVDSLVINDVLSTFGINEVLGRHKGFVNVAEELLMSDFLEILPPEKTVIEILETVKVSDALLQRCRELKERGFSLALDDNRYHPDYEPLYEIVDIVKIDILQVSSDSLKEMVDLLSNRGLILLAEKVETMEQYQFCLDLGFDLFQGYYFARPSVLNKKKINVSGIALFQLLDLVSRDAEIDEIEEAFKHNPDLSYNLLRLVNSVVIGMKEKIRTLRHALVVLGMRQLKRWIHLSLFTLDRTGSEGNPLLETAATRGRLMEVLVQKAEPAHRDYSDIAFMTGVLSLIDVLLGAPMEEILNQFNLAEEVRDALLERKGTLGDLLLLMEKLENMDFTDVASLLNRYHCGTDVLVAAQIEAIDWASSLNNAF